MMTMMMKQETAVAERGKVLTKEAICSIEFWVYSH
jgi:hypothetical protein